MTLFSYIVVSDDKYAPNPSNGVCTLAYCKYPMRPHVKEGDYVIGLGKKGLGNRVVYAMRVTETLEHDVYLRDPRFEDRRGDYDDPNSEEEIRQASRVLISTDFVYWGGEGRPLPERLRGLILDRHGYKSRANTPLIPEFLKWFKRQKRGCLGTPTAMLHANAMGTGKRKRKGC